MLMPLMCPLVCKFVCAGRIMQRIPTIIISTSQDSLDHRCLQGMSTAPSVGVITCYTSVRRTRRVLGSQLTCNVVCVPSRFDRSVTQNGRARIDVCYSVDKLLCCGDVLLTGATISLSVGQSVGVRHTNGAATQRSRVANCPVRCRSITLFGPAGNFTTFLVPTMLVLLVRRALLLNVNLSTKATQRGGHFGSLMPVGHRCGKALHVIVKGKLDCCVICSLMSMCMLYMIPHVFDLGRVKRPNALTLFVLPCLTTYVFFTVATSVTVHGQRAYVLIFMFASIPLLFVSKVS